MLIGTVCIGDTRGGGRERGGVWMGVGRVQEEGRGGKGREEGYLLLLYIISFYLTLFHTNNIQKN